MPKPRSAITAIPPTTEPAMMPAMLAELPDGSGVADWSLEDADAVVDVEVNEDVGGIEVADGV